MTAFDRRPSIHMREVGEWIDTCLRRMGAADKEKVWDEVCDCWMVSIAPHRMILIGETQLDVIDPLTEDGPQDLQTAPATSEAIAGFIFTELFNADENEQRRFDEIYGPGK